MLRQNGWKSSDLQDSLSTVSAKPKLKLTNQRLGKKTIDDRWEYTGELDDNGLACGHGVATQGNKQYKGTWFMDKRHGIGKDKVLSA